MPDDNFEKSAVAVLLCGPSAVHDEFMNANKSDLQVRGKLAGLGFSDAIIDSAMKNRFLIQKEESEAFRTVRARLMAAFWPDLPPHPPEPVVRAIVALGKK